MKVIKQWCWLFLLPSIAFGEVSPPSQPKDEHVPLNAISPDTLRTFAQVFDLIRRKYVGNVTDEQLFRYAMSGMLSQLDGHSEFLDRQAFDSLQAFSEGSIADVGLQASFDDENNAWVVTQLTADSPAEEAGIGLGDFLHTVGKTALDERTTSRQVGRLLSGLAGSQVELTISQSGRNKRTVTLQRTQPISDKLSLSVQDGVVVVHLPVFTEKTRSELNEALAHIKEPIGAMIIDVRGNPGGVLNSAIEVASLFLEQQPVVRVLSPELPPQVFSTTGNAPLANLPLMLLQDRHSASAAEVLALALQQNSNAIIAGETSYGKGSVQSVIPVGDQEAIKLSTAFYETMDGRKINGIGISPTLLLAGNKVDWLTQAIQTMQSQKLATGMVMSLSSDY